MTDNIIQFPNPDEVKDGDKGAVMARISIYEDGTAACWVSDDIQTDVEKTWLKAVLSDGVYGIHSIIHQDDDGTSSIAIKHFDDLEDKEYDDD